MFEQPRDKGLAELDRQEAAGSPGPLHPKDRVRVTFESNYEDVAIAMWHNAPLLKIATIEVLERADDPAKDPVSTVRQDAGGAMAVKLFQAIDWPDAKPWVVLEDTDSRLRDEEVVGWRRLVMAAVPADWRDQLDGADPAYLLESWMVPGPPAVRARPAVTVTEIEQWQEDDEETPPQPVRKSRPPFPYQIREWAEQEARVECFSGRDPSDVIHEGRIIGMTEAPTARVQKDDGQVVSWVIGLIRRAQPGVAEEYPEVSGAGVPFPVRDAPPLGSSDPPGARKFRYFSKRNYLLHRITPDGTVQFRHPDDGWTDAAPPNSVTVDWLESQWDEVGDVEPIGGVS